MVVANFVKRGQLPQQLRIVDFGEQLWENDVAELAENWQGHAL